MQAQVRKSGTWGPLATQMRSGLEADELRNLRGDDLRLEDRRIGFHVTDLAGGDLILCNFAGLAGTGINQRLRTILELACTARGNHNVAKIAIELLLNTHGVSLQNYLGNSHRSGLGVDDSESQEHGSDSRFRVSLAAFFRLCDQLFVVASRRAVVAAHSLGGYDGCHFLDRAVENIVDQNIAIFAVILNLFTSLRKAKADNLFLHSTFRAATIAQPVGKNFRRWRHNKDADGVGHLFANLRRPLYIDVEEHIFPLCESVSERLARSAVVIAENVGVLKELAGIDHALKFFAADEMILAGFLFGAARRARGIGNGELKIIDQRPELVDERGFARTGRGRDKKQDACQNAGVLLCIRVP